MNLLKRTLLIFLFFSVTMVRAQHANVWHFGNNSGLDFNTSPPTIITGGQTTGPDNSSAISDLFGNLLFYTDGMNVWDNTHSIMPNGSGLIGHSTSGQRALIVPIPCDPNKYVIFHVTEFSNPGNLNYTVVDMSLNNGLGDVVTSQKNISLGSSYTEKLCAYYNSAGNNYWVLTHKWNTNHFVAFNVNNTGIATNSVISSTGSIHNCGTYGGAHDGSGQLTISPDGTKVLNALTCQDKFELFQFNSATGVVSNPIGLMGDGGKAWGTAFSSNSQGIYVTSVFGQRIYQYNISTYNQPAILASQYTVVTSINPGYNYGYMELGPDSKLYISRPNSSFLSVVNNPNIFGIFCAFSNSGQSLGMQSSSWGLSRIAYNIPNATNQPSISTSNFTLCTNTSSSVAISANVTSSNQVTYHWLPPNVNGQTIIVSPLVNTTYTVSASTSNACIATTTLMVTVTNSCCNLPTNSYIQIINPSGNYANNSYIIASAITLSGSTVFKDAEILMMPGVSITVPPGMNLDLDHSHLYACGINMWQGIVVQDGGKVTTSSINKPTSLIEDAIVAIDVNGTSSSTLSSIVTPININNVIFNKNYIGIKISNSDPNISNYPLGITECVFTSRTMTFSSALPLGNTAWPNSSTAPGGLRETSTPTALQALNPPFLLSGFTPGNLKLPYPNQPGHIGIKIENVGNQPSILPTTGVDIGSLYTTHGNLFNLFDEIGVGIDIKDGSLKTINNIFQNMRQYTSNNSPFGGYGVYQNINSLMNAGLDLRPNFTTSDGNKFWNCWTGVYAQNVYETNIEYAVFRSNRVIGMGPGPGSNGITLISNRFNYDINHCEFNNVDNSLSFDAQTGQYNIVGNSNMGTYATQLMINQNYFGPQITSTTVLGSQYSNYAISLRGAAASNWQIGGNCNILSNKIDRTYRGISVDKMDRYPVEIGGNSILIFDDNAVQPGDQYGIYGKDSQDNLSVNQNTVQGQGITNTLLKLICLENNVSSSGNQFPKVTLNEVSNAHKGFSFEGNQPTTLWECNTLYTPMDYGLALENNGVIGIQGSPTVESGNEYLGTWGPTNYYTFCDQTSNPSNSPLYVAVFQNTNPGSITHFGAGGFIYGNGSTFIANFPLGYAVNDCLYSTNYPGLPNQRAFGIETIPNKTDLSLNNEEYQVFPNPTNENIVIKSERAEMVNVKIRDLTSKLVYEQTAYINEPILINVSPFNAGIYLIEIYSNEGNLFRTKLIKTNP